MREQEDKEAQLIIPRGLQAEVIHLKYEGHQGTDQTLGLMRQTCCFPDMGAGGQGQGVCGDLPAMPSTTAQDRDRAYQADPVP